MMWWKVSYDFRRPNWTSFGRNAFVKAADHDAALVRASRLVGLIEDGATILRLEITPSTLATRLRFWKRVQAARVWKHNVAHGIPNDRRSL